MIEIKGAIKHYDWGGYYYLPMLLDNHDARQPFAELWLGDHLAGSSTLVDGSPLSAWIEAAPEYRLGKKVVEQFGQRLPYLFKVLDVREPLSIQVHPTLEQAKQGFARENALAIESSRRNYKDNNHKPELMLALSDFYLLHGFRNVTESVAELKKYKSTDSLASLYQELGLKAFVSTIFSLPENELSGLVLPIIKHYRLAYQQNELAKSQSLFWFMRAALRAEREALPFDAGLLMIFIMNLMYVPKGSVVYQDAGIPHAYLEGQNIELMANSDNVIRAGLTAKHVDVQELLAITRFETITPEVVSGEPTDDGGIEYRVPAKDFQLREYHLHQGQALTTPDEEGACVWFVLSGEVRLSNQQHYSRAGSAFYQRPEEVNIIYAQSDTWLYRASAVIE
ncbi:mannose-6-phosphate isomerase, class I [Vibrio cincinnatiensis]|uniref:mannose-6-phosphate isomerase, class I n=1 Tax=Vibrio cincinnatiensis TaxID=675 RepID=UPI001EDD79A6|nr:mannose-6-phosphate isomerase, class I [Vibrio cincinnatiensis]MCG3720873.1 mannose-6-phosphate isomerase, class I [Vibrio cincinnatiensis]MCG3765389.1 mannose-6-phosphate isomerase, class I [Vibrio cincinnatiensis]